MEKLIRHKEGYIGSVKDVGDFLKDEMISILQIKNADLDYVSNELKRTLEVINKLLLKDDKDVVFIYENNFGELDIKDIDL